MNRAQMTRTATLIIAAIAFLCSASATTEPSVSLSQAADATFPDGTVGREILSDTGKPEMVTESPSGQYSIITSCRSEFTGTGEYRSCDAGLHTVLHFRDKSKPEATLAVDFPDTSLGQSRYFFSPDERWIIRDQHVGAGTNNLTLYAVNPNGIVSSVDIYKLAFDFIFTRSRCSQVSTVT